MKKYRCIIIDDEQLARMLIEGYIKKMPQLELLGSFRNPVEAASFVHESEVDIIFLDIQMPELSGLDFLKSLQYPPKIILITAYPQYALEGYELNVSDYLLKPVTYDRFLQAIHKVSAQLDLEDLKNNDNSVKLESTDKNFILIKSEHRVIRLRYHDIMYVEGLREYLIFHTINKKISTLKSLKSLEEELPSDNFMRVHKSFIVNTDKVDALYGNQLEIGEHKIPIGKNYKQSVLEKLF